MVLSILKVSTYEADANQQSTIEQKVIVVGDAVDEVSEWIPRGGLVALGNKLFATPSSTMLLLHSSKRSIALFAP